MIFGGWAVVWISRVERAGSDNGRENRVDDAGGVTTSSTTTTTAATTLLSMRNMPSRGSRGIERVYVEQRIPGVAGEFGGGNRQPPVCG